MLPYVEQSNLFQLGGIPNKTLAQSNIAATRINLYLCPSDTAYNAPPYRTDTGNLPGFPVGNTNYKGVSVAPIGLHDSSSGGWFPTLWRHQGANGLTMVSITAMGPCSARTSWGCSPAAVHHGWTLQHLSDWRRHSRP